MRKNGTKSRLKLRLVLRISSEIDPEWAIHSGSPENGHFSKNLVPHQDTTTVRTPKEETGTGELCGGAKELLPRKHRSLRTSIPEGRR